MSEAKPLVAVQRPVCAQCGKGYGEKSTKPEVMVWPGREPMPAYQGPGVVVKVHPNGRGPQPGHGMAMGVPYQKGDRVAFLEVWDGVTYVRTASRPFCTSRCALDYAREAWRERRGDAEEKRA